MPRFSFILPIYNVEKYLSLCIDSLRSQSFNDLEIICVDDGSTDRSAKIAQLHASCDSRIKVIRRKNGGPSAARNTGLSFASGEYVLFIDSDDYLEKNACAVLDECIANEAPDVITFGANCVPGGYPNSWLERCFSPQDAVYNGFTPELLFRDDSKPYAWRTLFRRSFLEDNDIRFNESLKLGEDQLLHFEIYPLSRKTVLLSNKLYNYRVMRAGSQMDQLFVHDVETRVTNHLAVVRAIFEAWSRRDLMDLCPVELLDWVLDYLFTDTYKLESRDSAFSAIRSAILDNMPNAVENAEHLPSVCRKIMLGILKPSDAKGISRSMLWRYTAYRLGMKRYIVGTVRRPFNALCSLLRPVVPASRPYIDIQTDNVRECIQMEASLLQSIACLEAERMCNGREPAGKHE